MRDKELTFKNFVQLANQLPYYLKKYIGAGAYVSNTQKINEEMWYFSISNTYPAFVDVTGEEPIIKFLDFKDIGIAVAEIIDDKIHLEIPDRESLWEKMNDKHRSLLTKAETSLLDITYINLVKIPNVKVALNRIRSVLLDLESKHQLELADYPKKERGRYSQYLKFLQDLEYVRKEIINDREIYVEGNKLSIIKHELLLDGEDLYIKILADILKRGYDYIGKQLRLLQIIPYLRIINSYYFPSFEFDRLLKIKKGREFEFFSIYLKSLYGIKKKEYKLRPQIQDIILCEVLEEKNNYIIGKEEIYEEFSNEMKAIV